MLGELAAVFLKLGTIAFGGPAVHIAMMEGEVVRRRRWMSREEFLDLLGATNLIPGPNSTEMALFVGHRRAGWKGLVVAGMCFITPATVIVAVIASMYARVGRLPETQSILYGVKPVVIAVVVQAIWGLARSAVKTPLLAVIALASLIASLLRANELLILVAAGLASGSSGSFAVLGGWLATGAAGGAVPFGLWPLFLFFLKVGSVLFGSGYVLLAFLRADLVERFHWLTESQLLDAIAVGQVTPGPVFTTATFVGYVLGGPGAALVATVGIFLPAFFFVAVSGPLIPRIRRSPAAAAALDGVNAASLGLMAAVTVTLARTAVIDAESAIVAAYAAALLLGTKLNSAWLVLGGTVIGYLWKS